MLNMHCMCMKINILCTFSLTFTKFAKYAFSISDFYLSQLLLWKTQLLRIGNYPKTVLDAIKLNDIELLPKYDVHYHLLQIFCQRPHQKECFHAFRSSSGFRTIFTETLTCDPGILAYTNTSNKNKEIPSVIDISYDD